MHVFYFNIPWIINETEYNCSGRTLSEWKSRGSVNEVQGLYYAVTGIFFVALYVVCLIGMYRGKLLKTPCYRLMFFNGFIDIMDLFSSSLFPAYFHLTGSVFCSSPAFNWFAGYFSWCVWSGASFNCAVLALNRVVEMIPSAKFLRFLFKAINSNHADLFNDRNYIASIRLQWILTIFTGSRYWRKCIMAVESRVGWQYTGTEKEDIRTEVNSKYQLEE
ncbi:hypothetical protein TELCIR_09170 [Teladorsagia circumcincta]|uniref:G-protein coupled receptors family 1 profile domain-containing protein n=1 Tax=Teladorsagia circumcincta TaxID=45464 RepID=A0A2G9UFI1_TELCI|nr:hypothetical protein TELCIR_09170 [Teladorsagia circumcincta]